MNEVTKPDVTSVGNTNVQGPTWTLHAVGKFGHYFALLLLGVSWAGEHLHLVADQSQGTIQVTIAGTAVAFVGERIAKALAAGRGK